MKYYFYCPKASKDSYNVDICAENIINFMIVVVFLFLFQGSHSYRAGTYIESLISLYVECISPNSKWLWQVTLHKNYVISLISRCFQGFESGIQPRTEVCFKNYTWFWFILTNIKLIKLKIKLVASTRVVAKHN